MYGCSWFYRRSYFIAYLDVAQVRFGKKGSELVEVSTSDIISDIIAGYVGETAKAGKDLFDANAGAVLFIDNAHL